MESDERAHRRRKLLKRNRDFIFRVVSIWTFFFQFSQWFVQALRVSDTSILFSLLLLLSLSMLLSSTSYFWLFGDDNSRKKKTKQFYGETKKRTSSNGSCNIMWAHSYVNIYLNTGDNNNCFSPFAHQQFSLL